MPCRLPIRGLAALLLLAAVTGAGCSREQSLGCSPDTLYLEARAAGQLRIPGGLNAPDETDSLRIPEPLPPVAPSGDDPDRCLEASPGLVRND